MNRLTGIHSLREALEADRPLDSLIVARGSHGNRIEDLVRLARQHGIPVRFEERIQLDRTAGTRAPICRNRKPPMSITAMMATQL